jgi:hypothetical protein
MTTSTLVRKQLEIIEVKPGLKFPLQLLIEALPDVETTLFFGKLYKLDTYQLGELMRTLHNSDVLDALLGEGGMHSTELQDYVVELGYEYLINQGDVVFGAAQPKGEILPEVWESLQIEVAASIQKVAETLGDVVAHLPGKQGEMLFKSMAVMNKRRPTIGSFNAFIKHQRHAKNLVILDVSGSMSENTVKTIIDDVVALSWQADACLAIVSNSTTWWEPGSFNSEVVLKAAQFGGTHYETLAELLDQDWGVVVTIADYDSSRGAQQAIANCSGSIELLLDISLVPQPTFLAECVGQLAKETRPLLIAEQGTSLCS